MSGMHYSSMVYSMGVPTVGDAMMTQGKSFFVNPRTGSDGNKGTDINEPLATLSQALSMATEDQNDVVYLLASDNSASGTTDYQSETLDWNKDNVHLIGVAAPTKYGKRARIAQLSTATGVSPLFKVSANSCIIKNIHVFHGVADATSKIAVQITGSRNYIENCHFAGIGNATMDVATACTLSLSGAEENTFVDCVIGLDTVARGTAATYEMDFASGSTRNSFYNCVFPTMAEDAGYVFFNANSAADLDRTTLFQDCSFINAVGSTATTMTEWGDVHASAGGLVLLKNCSLVGATDWEAATESGNVYVDGAAPTAASSGLAVNVSAS